MWGVAARLLQRSTDALFTRVDVDAGWAATVRAAAARGPLVHVLRNVVVADYLALQHVLARLGLPRIGFVNEMPRWVAPESQHGSPVALRAALAAGQSVVLFVKRAPDALSSGGVRSHGDELLAALVREQDARPDREIELVPQTFVWSAHPERREASLLDALFGPADFPGELRTAAQVVLNRRSARLRAGEPLGLRAFLAEQRQPIAANATEGPHTPSDRTIVRRLTYAMLHRVERERRAIVGPARMPVDRLREAVLRSRRLQTVIAEMAGPDRGAQELLRQKARTMLRELETAPDPQTQRGLELAIERLVSRVYSSVDVDRDGLDRLRDAARRGAVVLLPSHKSHVDYVALSYVLRKNGIQLPVVAAGDNLAFFPLGALLRRAGAFFIRRSFAGDRLYIAVVDAYVRRLLRSGHMLELFLEGGRSRTGKLLPPQLGMLNLIVSAALGLEGRRVTFVPVSIGYERLMEERSFARELSGRDKPREDATALLRVGELLLDRWGRIDIQFGHTIELDELLGELGVPRQGLSPAKRRSVVKALGHRAMSEIDRVTAITAGALVAMILLSHGGRGISYAQIGERARRLATVLAARGARMAPSLAGSEGEPLRESALREALALYVRGGLLRQHVPGDTLSAGERRHVRLQPGSEVVFQVPDDKRLRLDFAKNGILHLVIDRAFVAVALRAELASRDGRDRNACGIGSAAIRTRVFDLVRLLRHEFTYRADAPFASIFDELVADMAARGEIVVAHESVSPPRSDEGRSDLAFYAATVQPLLESYRVAARSLRSLVRGPAGDKELAQRALRHGERMFLHGEIHCAEAVSRPPILNAFAAFVDQGYLGRRERMLALTESFASAEAVPSVEARVAALLPPQPG